MPTPKALRRQDPRWGSAATSRSDDRFALLRSRRRDPLCYAADAGHRILRRLALGGEGGWDYLTVDPDARRLYISRSTHVVVVDLQTHRAIGEIPNTPGVHGIALAPDLNRGFTSNGKADTVAVFDLKTLKILDTVKTGANPDAILYDPPSGRVFTFNGRSQDSTVFDASSGSVLATIGLGGKPEFATSDEQGSVFVNIESTSEVVQLDSRRLTLSRRFSLKPCEEPTSMAIDRIHHRVFSGCHNRLMPVLDTESGKLTATVPIGAGVDGNGYDPGTETAYSSNGEGTLTVVREVSPDKFSVVETVKTERGARTMALDLKTQEIYLPTAKFVPSPSAAGSNPRREIVPDSFVVLVVGRSE